MPNTFVIGAALPAAVALIGMHAEMANQTPIAPPAHGPQRRKESTACPACGWGGGRLKGGPLDDRGARSVLRVARRTLRGDGSRAGAYTGPMNADQLLERTQWDTFWVPPDTAVVDRPELLFTAHPGGAPMLNAVHRVRAHDREEREERDGRAAHGARDDTTPARGSR